MGLFDEIATAQRERNRRMTALTTGNGDPFQIGQSIAQLPGWDAFFGSQHDQQEDAAAHGRNYRVDMSGIGGVQGPAGGGSRLTQTDREGLVGNAALGQLVDQNRVRLLQQQEMDDKDREEAIAAMKQSEQEQRSASMVPQAPAPVTTQSVDEAGNPSYTMRPNPAETQRQRILSLIPGPLQAEYQKRFADLDQSAAQTAATNAKTATEIGPGSLQDFITRTATSKNKPVEALTPQEVDEARQTYLDTTAAAGTQGPKVQQGLEKQYRDILAKQFSSRSGDLGVQNGKISQAAHLLSLFDQNKDAQGNYNLNPQMLSETALGLANLISGSNGATQEMTRNLTPESLKGDVGKALQYITGQQQNGSTQDLTKVLRDSIVRQGTVAQQLRGKHFDEMRAMAPTDLAANRREALEKSMGLTSIDANPAANAPGTVRLVSPDGKSTRDVPADQVDHYLKQGAKRAGG